MFTIRGVVFAGAKSEELRVDWSNQEDGVDGTILYWVESCGIGGMGAF